MHLEKTKVQNHKTTKFLRVQIIDRLRELGAEIHYVNLAATGVRSPMLWRFLVADDQSVDVFISRDSDSRLTERDSWAVRDWLEHPDGRQPAPFHCIRDHPSHGLFAANGGMWGARRREFISVLGGRSFASLLASYGSNYGDDMRFLDAEVWSALVGSPTPALEGGVVAQSSMVLCHDSVTCDRWPGAVPFPVPRSGLEHVGQVFDGWSRSRKGDLDLLSDAIRNPKCEPERTV